MNKNRKENMELTTDQTIAYDTILTAFASYTPVLLTGSAGTGKTTLTKCISQYCMLHNMEVCGIAPTHKAAHVLEDVLNAAAILPIPVFTVASILGKMKEHSYIGAKTFGQKNTNKLANYMLFIVDEISMTADSDIQTIVQYAKTHQRRLLLIGDEYQLPPPSAGYEIVVLPTPTPHTQDGINKSDTPAVNTHVIQKRNSYVFSHPAFTRANLTSIVRQAADSPIIQLATKMRDCIRDYVPIVTQDHYLAECIIPYDQITEYYKIKSEQYTREQVKIIAYTNAAVIAHNKSVRRHLRIDMERFVVGEILMGYTNIGFPELIVENGQDYKVTAVQETGNKQIETFRPLCGTQLSLQLIGSAGSKRQSQLKSIFCIHVNHPANELFMKELISRANRVNLPRSTKTDFTRYMSLKTQAIFMDNIYSYQGQVFTEESFRETHPLLFTSLSELVNYESGKLVPSLKLDKINQTYENIVSARLLDTKTMGDSERLSDKFMVIEKDIYYGYAITAHKSQGSGYDCVLVDTLDFAKLSDRWNHRHNKLESRLREKQQLEYVAYTRAKRELFIS